MTILENCHDVLVSKFAKLKRISMTWWETRVDWEDLRWPKVGTWVVSTSLKTAGKWRWSISASDPQGRSFGGNPGRKKSWAHDHASRINAVLAHGSCQSSDLHSLLCHIKLINGKAWKNFTAAVGENPSTLAFSIFQIFCNLISEPHLALSKETFSRTKSIIFSAKNMNSEKVHLHVPPCVRMCPHVPSNPAPTTEPVQNPRTLSQKLVCLISQDLHHRNHISAQK